VKFWQWTLYSKVNAIGCTQTPAYMNSLLYAVYVLLQQNLQHNQSFVPIVRHTSQR
jgi:hypothetical protein